MATDNSPPRNKIIAIGALVTVVILVLLHFAFDSYFIMMMENEAAAKIAKPEELQSYRAAEQKKLQESPLPIGKAMQQVAAAGDRAALITPQASSDDAPMTGWGQGSRALAAKASASADGGAAASPDVAGDGGAAVAPGSVPNQDALQPADGGLHLVPDSGLTADGGRKLDPRHTKGPLAPTRPNVNTGGGPTTPANQP